MQKCCRKLKVPKVFSSSFSREKLVLKTLNFKFCFTSILSYSVTPSTPLKKNISNNFFNYSCVTVPKNSTFSQPTTMQPHPTKVNRFSALFGYGFRSTILLTANLAKNSRIYMNISAIHSAWDSAYSRFSLATAPQQMRVYVHL